MRHIARPLDALFPRTRQAVLGSLLVHSGKWWYISDLARHLDTTPSSLQRELAQLAAAEILLTRKDGNRVYFKADTENPMYPELRRLMEKTSGFVGVLRQTLFANTAPRIAVAFVFGSTARGQEDSVSDIDLLIVGGVTLEGITPKLRRAEKRLGREISAIVFRPDEFAEKIRAGNHFLKAVLEKEKLFVVGAQRDLEAVARGKQRAAAHPDKDGDR